MEKIFIRSCRAVLIAVTMFAAGTTPASAVDVWNESINGDLSTNENAPTSIFFLPGSNVIRGSVFSTADPRDYFTFTLGPGEALTRINLLSYVDMTTGGPGNRGYNAINLGATSFIPSVATANNFLGGNHLDPLPPGTDILPGLAAATTNGTGFSIPLGPGTYSYLVQQTSTLKTNYALEFVVVPGPGSAAALMLAAGIACCRTRKSRRA